MEWTRGPTIGRGASATVSLATGIPSGEVFAVKSAELSRASFLQKENQILAQLSSPRIVKYMGHDISCEDGKFTYNLCMEYVPGGTISDAIKNHGGWLDESTIRAYTSQIVQGLGYLHMNNLVHCDIKGSNVLVSKDGVKIADFGCARFVEANGGDATSAFSGTPVFMAPEVARGEEQGFPADIWALGCTIIEMATGCSNPWPEVNDPVSALYRIGFSGDIPEFPKAVSDKAKDFLSKCLRRDPTDRWTAKQLLQHPFLEDEMDLTSDQLIKESTKNSPTSVLDQDFWDSLEVSQTLQNTSNSSNSPVDRIGKLVGNTLFSSSNLPDWSSWDESWITVRTNVMHVDEIFAQTALVMVSIIHEDELGDLNFDGDLLFDFSFEDVSAVNSFGYNRGHLTDCVSVNPDTFVLRSLIYETDNENFLFPLISTPHLDSKFHHICISIAVCPEILSIINRMLIWSNIICTMILSPISILAISIPFLLLFC